MEEVGGMYQYLRLVFFFFFFFFFFFNQFHVPSYDSYAPIGVFTCSDRTCDSPGSEWPRDVTAMPAVKSRYCLFSMSHR